VFVSSILSITFRHVYLDLIHSNNTILHSSQCNSPRLSSFQLRLVANTPKPERVLYVLGSVNPRASAVLRSCFSAMMATSLLVKHVSLLQPHLFQHTNLLTLQATPQNGRVMENITVQKMLAQRSAQMYVFLYDRLGARANMSQRKLTKRSIV
jgi:hypothetical protein